MPQVSGQLTEIRVHSGEQVKSGQVLMEIDARQQQATVDSQRATERQKKALDDYNTVELDRQHKLFEAGVTSRDAFEQAQQAFQNAKADYESAVESRKAQEQLLAYYTIRAPFEGVVGDIPVHIGDYVSPNQSPATMLTTVDENKDLEAYIYIPTERSGDIASRAGGGPDGQQRQAAGEDADRFHLAGGGQHFAGNSGEGSRGGDGRNAAQRANGEGRGNLEHKADGRWFRCWR